MPDRFPGAAQHLAGTLHRANPDVAARIHRAFAQIRGRTHGMKRGEVARGRSHTLCRAADALRRPSTDVGRTAAHIMLRAGMRAGSEECTNAHRADQQPQFHLLHKTAARLATFHQPG